MRGYFINIKPGEIKTIDSSINVIFENITNNFNFVTYNKRKNHGFAGCIEAPWSIRTSVYTTIPRLCQRDSDPSVIRVTQLSDFGECLIATAGDIISIKESKNCMLYGIGARIVLPNTEEELLWDGNQKNLCTFIKAYIDFWPIPPENKHLDLKPLVCVEGKNEYGRVLLKEGRMLSEYSNKNFKDYIREKKITLVQESKTSSF